MRSKFQPGQRVKIIKPLEIHSPTKDTNFYAEAFNRYHRHAPVGSIVRLDTRTWEGNEYWENGHVMLVPTPGYFVHESCLAEPEIFVLDLETGAFTYEPTEAV